MKAVKYLVCALLLAVLAGCASYPISKDLRKQARQVAISQVRADPKGTRGTLVIWGGRIINVVNNSNGGSMYILCLPVENSGKPAAEGPSPGRFVATSRNYLDPETFPRGRLITVAGQLNGIWTERLDKMEYAYPVVYLKEAHVWPAESQGYPYYGYPYYGYYGPYWYSYWGPGWGWWGGYPFFYYGGFPGGFHGSFHGGHGGGGGGHGH